MLIQTVESVLAQDIDLNQIEIIIVTQNQYFDRSMLPMSGNATITVIEQPETDTISALRNTGASQSKADYLAFLDADIQLSSNWIHAMKSELAADNQRVLVSAIQRCEQNAPVLEKLRTVLSNATVDTDVAFLPGRNLFLKRETFEAVGRFPEHLVTCEDYYFTDKVHEIGKLYYSSKADYIHLGEDKIHSEMFNKEIWRGQSNLQSLKGRKISLRESASFAVPIWLLLFFLVALVSLLSAEIFYFFSAMAMIALPIALYALRLYKIGKGKLSLKDTFIFYSYYFPARVIGTVSGIFKSIPWSQKHPKNEKVSAGRLDKKVSGEKKINVLQFTCPAGFYGAERWVLALARHLNKKTMTCDLAVTKEPGQGELEIVRQYTADMGTAYEIAMKHPFDFGVVSRLCDLIREQDIDIIHTHGYKSDIIGIIAARKTGIISVSTPHGFENTKEWKLRAYIWLGSQTFRFFTKVAPLSQQLYDDVIRMGAKKENVVYIQNGVDLQEVEEHRDSDESIERGDEKRIGFVGQMISRKNVFDLLDIFNGLSAKYGNMKLLLLGDGEQRQQLEEYANTLPEKDHIEFLGFRDDRLELLKSFDIFVMTSTLEGIPRCLMETMAMGIPVAAYDIAGIDQLITHQKSGLLAPLGDKDALAGFCEKILFDPEYAKSLADNARRYVYEAFSAQRMAKDYEQLFNELMSDKLAKLEK